MKQFNKYQYLGYHYPGVSKHWYPTILEMFKRIDKQVRPWYIPRFILNIIPIQHDLLKVLSQREYKMFHF